MYIGYIAQDITLLYPTLHAIYLREPPNRDIVGIRDVHVISGTPCWSILPKNFNYLPTMQMISNRAKIPFFKSLEIDFSPSYILYRPLEGVNMPPYILYRPLKGVSMPPYILYIDLSKT